MKCPNCLAEVNSTNYPKDGLNVCPYCMNTWTTKQQAELSTLRSELTALPYFRRGWRRLGINVSPIQDRAVARIWIIGVKAMAVDT